MPAEASDIQAAIDRELETASDVGALDTHKGPTNRRLIILSICAVTLQAASSFMFIIGEFTEQVLQTITG